MNRFRRVRSSVCVILSVFAQSRHRKGCRCCCFVSLGWGRCCCFVSLGWGCSTPCSSWMPNRECVSQPQHHAASETDSTNAGSSDNISCTRCTLQGTNGLFTELQYHRQSLSMIRNLQSYHQQSLSRGHFCLLLLFARVIKSLLRLPPLLVITQPFSGQYFNVVC